MNRKNGQMNKKEEDISFSLSNAVEIYDLLIVVKDACVNNNYFEMETLLNIILQKQKQVIEKLSLFC